MEMYECKQVVDHSLTPNKQWITANMQQLLVSSENYYTVYRLLRMKRRELFMNLKKILRKKLLKNPQQQRQSHLPVNYWTIAINDDCD